MTLRPRMPRAGQPAKLAGDLAPEQQTKTITMPCSHTRMHTHTHMHVHTQTYKPNRWLVPGGTQRPLWRRQEREHLPPTGLCRRVPGRGASVSHRRTGTGLTSWAQTAKPLGALLTPASPQGQPPQTQRGKAEPSGAHSEPGNRWTRTQDANRGTSLGAAQGASKEP